MKKQQKDLQHILNKMCKDFPAYQKEAIEIMYMPNKQKWFVGIRSRIVIMGSVGYEYIEENVDVVEAINRIRFRNGMDINKI